MREAELLYEAFNSDFGIEVELFGNYQVSLQRLYAAKRKDPDLEIIQIFKSPSSHNHIWIVKNDTLRHPNAQPPAPALSVQPIKQNPQGEGPLFSLADLFGDE